MYSEPIFPDARIKHGPIHDSDTHDRWLILANPRAPIPLPVMTANYDSTARSLSYPLSPPHSPGPASTFPRPFLARSRSRRVSFSQPPLPQRLLQTAEHLGRQSLRAFRNLTLFQQALLVAAFIFSAAFGILFLLYNEQIFAWLVPVAEKWRNLPGGWVILWVMTIATAFPPVIGYSTCVTIAGFLYGFPAGSACPSPLKGPESTRY